MNGEKAVILVEFSVQKSLQLEFLVGAGKLFNLLIDLRFLFRIIRLFTVQINQFSHFIKVIDQLLPWIIGVLECIELRKEFFCTIAVVIAEESKPPPYGIGFFFYTFKLTFILEKHGVLLRLIFAPL